MKVKLLKPAEDIRLWNENVACKAAALCLDKLNTASTKNMEAAINSGHLSVIEHLPLTFLVEDISRACSHQLVRHRIASYSQISQRYAKVDTNEKWYITPNTIKENILRPIRTIYGQKVNNLEDAYHELMCHIGEFYKKACESDIPNEDARMVLPNACFTSIIVSMNARSFSEAATLRTCNKAQWEIRELFTQMRELVKDIYPHVYKLSFPNCYKKQGCLESKPCGIKIKLINGNNNILEDNQ